MAKKKEQLKLTRAEKKQLQELMTRMGPDSRAARVAAVVVGSSETIFYTMTVYLAAAGVKKLPRALGISLLSWLAGVAAACCICR